MLIYGFEFNLDLKLDPQVSKWTFVSKDPKSGVEVYDGGGYNLRLDRTAGEISSVVKFDLERKDHSQFTVDHYLVSAFGDMGDVWRIWNPYYLHFYLEFLTLNRINPWEGRRAVADTLVPITTTERGIPIILALNRRGDTTLALGMINQNVETKFWAYVATHIPFGELERGKMLFRLRRPLEGYKLGPLSHYRDGFFVCKGPYWFDAMQQYAKVHDQLMNRAIKQSPDTSWEPLWMPWASRRGEWSRTHQNEVDEELLLEAMKIGRKIGIKTVHALNWSWGVREEWRKGINFEWGWPDLIGDFLPDKRFQDFRGTVRKLHQMGAWFTVWINPFMAGRETRVRRKVSDALIDVDLQKSDPRYNIATSYLCPRNPMTQDHIVDTMVRVMRDYELDGFCLDMLDSIPLEPCIAKHEHNFSSLGLAMDYCLSRIKEAIDNVKPDAILEFRQRYANINNLNYATAFRAIDSGDTGEFDFDRRQCVILRSYVPSGVAVHTDPIWWRIDEKDTMVAKMLSTMVISGVPQLGVDLINIPESHQDLIRCWLNFYQEHKKDFKNGTFRPIQNDPWFSTIIVQSQGKTFVSHSLFPALEVPLQKKSEEIYLMNCTEKDSLYTILSGPSGRYSAHIYDHTISPLSKSNIESKENKLFIDMNIPQGGYCLLKRSN